MVPIPDLSSEDMVTLGLIIFDDGALSVNSKTSPPTDINVEMKFIKVSVSPTGDFAVVADTDRILRVFDLSTGLIVPRSTPHNLYLHPDIVLFRTSVL
ncbi:hypothetical protein SeLEV6574_g01958 [Synchytrium endobioticum]|uniref:Uncharacterized protein n=1 Tax=Synchytrium endobioticum TaxID=286115 RepID=A0A507DA93_9FUNG|nr:hypothetical protein SeLEV6574_g01958 [Synchytrium endobioticum]